MSNFNLNWLLFPYTKDFFANEFFEVEHLHIKRSESSYYTNLLNAENLDCLLGSRQFRFPSLRLTKAGEELTSENYSNDKNIDLSAVHKFFLDGYTIILNAFHEQNQDLGELVNGLSHELGHPFQTNIYITPPNSQGFPAHYDTHDVFVLQIEGSKTWRIYHSSPEILPSKQMEFQKVKHPTPQMYTELELEQGDLLYIPRGMMHDAQTNSSLSVHVTLGWLGYTWTDVLVQMVLEFSKNSTLPRKFVDPFKMHGEKELKEEFHQVISQFINTSDPNASLNEFRIELSSNQRFFFNDLLKNAVNFNRLSHESTFLKRPIVSLSLEKRNEEVILKLAAKEIVFPIYTLNSLEFILNVEQSFSFKELPDDLDDEGKVVLLKRLVKEGVITIE